MESILSPYARQPHTEVKHFYSITNDYIVGAGSMQGWRTAMEDTFAVIITVPPDPFTSFFGVFDGHGGKVVAEFLSENMHNFVVTDPIYMDGNIERGIESAFMRLDEFMKNHGLDNSQDAGSTAIVVLIRNDLLYCANVGDSRAVAYVQGEVIPLSADHKPLLPVERDRIDEAGGFIFNDRINGDLSLSRAFGDYRFKQNRGKNAREQVVIALPDVTAFSISKDWEFVVLACDGIWEVMSNEQVCRFVKMRINLNIKPNDICVQLLDECLSKENPSFDTVGTDNMTVIIVVFLHNARSSYVKINDKPSISVKYVCK